MQNIFFFQTQQIPDSSIFNQFKEQKIFFSYFQVDENYYLFMYAQKSIDINFVYQSVEIIEELDSKQRKIRSLRGFFLYALEIMEKGKDHEILHTNLQPFFWRKVKDTIRQNKKAALQQFLSLEDTDKQHDNKGSNPKIQLLENQIQNLQNQVNSLQQKVIQLEAKFFTAQQNSKDLLSDTLNVPNDIKITQQGNYTLEGEKDPYWIENQSQIRDSTYQTKDIQSKSLLKHGVNFDSDASKIHFKDSDTTLTGYFATQQYNQVSNQKKTLNQHNFITLSNLSEDQKIEIIQRGFQLQSQGKISLKKYYENTDPNSLFQLKGYRIKYESIRRTKLYQQLKE